MILNVDTSLLVKYDNLSVLDLLVFDYVCRCNKERTARYFVARTLKISERTVSRCFERLKECGLIEQSLFNRKYYKDKSQESNVNEAKELFDKLYGGIK